MAVSTRLPRLQFCIFLDSAYPRICGALHIRRFRLTTPIFGGELREVGSESVDEFGADHRRILRGTSARERWQTTQRQARQHK